MSDQRYYNYYTGSFWSPDPVGLASANPRNPTSWNRYTYVYDDPINFFDPQGTDGCSAEYGTPCFSVTGTSGSPDPTSGNPSPGGSQAFGGEGGGRSDLALDLGTGDSAPPDPVPPPYRPECDRSRGNKAKKLDWIASHGDDAATAAANIGTTEAIILGLSALESGWGTGPYVIDGRNNYFSQHAPAPGSNGSVTQNGNTMATYESYLASALGFDQSKSGQLILNMNDAAQVASTLQNAGLYGINRDGSKVPNFVKDVANTINGLALRLDCPH